MKKILIIGNHPPPMCGWAIQTQLVQKELRRRGCVCEVMNINENRKVKSAEYTDIQNGADYLGKVVSFAARGYRIHAHVNGESNKLLVLAFTAVIIARVFGRPVILSFHGGLPQTYFPAKKSVWQYWGFKALFTLASMVSCDSSEIKDAIEKYGVRRDHVVAIP